MKVTPISIIPPPTALNEIRMTPELLAASFAKYSRSNLGMDHIAGSIDYANMDKSVDGIFKFVDYGHASISGMTGGIPMAIDGISMWLAFKLFDITQLTDGQESSTRYIKMDVGNVVTSTELGLVGADAERYDTFIQEAFRAYHSRIAFWNARLAADPSLLQIPDNANEKVKARLRNNFALDRARYFIPLATKTNVAMVCTARVWVETIKWLLSHYEPEPLKLGAMLRDQLAKYAPRLVKHAAFDAACRNDILDEMTLDGYRINKHGSEEQQNSECDVIVAQPDIEHIGALPYNYDFHSKQNRYSRAGRRTRRTVVTAKWSHVTIAELRDLNRHRSGNRSSMMVMDGFYYGPGGPLAGEMGLVDKSLELLKEMVHKDFSCYPYMLLLGAQVPYEQTMMLDKFIYEIELRTGLGAHFKYAEHMRDAAKKLLAQPGMDVLAPHIQIGTNEPE